MPLHDGEFQEYARDHTLDVLLVEEVEQWRLHVIQEHFKDLVEGDLAAQDTNLRIDGQLHAIDVEEECRLFNRSVQIFKDDAHMVSVIKSTVVVEPDGAQDLRLEIAEHPITGEASEGSHPIWEGQKILLLRTKYLRMYYLYCIASWWPWCF